MSGRTISLCFATWNSSGRIEIWFVHALKLRAWFCANRSTDRQLYLSRDRPAGHLRFETVDDERRPQHSTWHHHVFLKVRKNNVSERKQGAWYNSCPSCSHLFFRRLEPQLLTIYFILQGRSCQDRGIHTSLWYNCRAGFRKLVFPFPDILGTFLLREMLTDITLFSCHACDKEVSWEPWISTVKVTPLNILPEVALWAVRDADDRCRWQMPMLKMHQRETSSKRLLPSSTAGIQSAGLPADTTPASEFGGVHPDPSQSVFPSHPDSSNTFAKASL